MSQETVIFSADPLHAASERRHAEQMQRLVDRSKAALNVAGLHALAAAVVNPLQAILPLALLEKWDVSRLLDEVIAYAAALELERGPERFDDVIREAWQAPGQTFGTASLLAGLVTAYNGAVKASEAFVASFEPHQEPAETPTEQHHPEAHRPTALKPLVPFRRRLVSGAQRSDRDDA